MYSLQARVIGDPDELLAFWLNWSQKTLCSNKIFEQNLNDIRESTVAEKKS